MADTSPLADFIARAFATYGSRCLWNVRYPSDGDDVGLVVCQLRRYGDLAAWDLAVAIARAADEMLLASSNRSSPMAGDRLHTVIDGRDIGEDVLADIQAMVLPHELAAAVAARDAAHAAWVAAASPQAPRAILVSDDKSRAAHAAWDAWAAACSHVADLEEAIGGQ